MKTIVTTHGQIDLPNEICQQDSIVPGQQFDLRRIGTGCYLLLRETPESTGEKRGTLAWLRSCPHDDWFAPIPSESTDEL